MLIWIAQRINAVINGVVNQIYGKGLDATDSSTKARPVCTNEKFSKAKRLPKKCLPRFEAFRGSKLFKLLTHGSKISAITHFPRETLRAEKMNDKGEIKNYFYSADWSKVNTKYKTKKVSCFW